MPSDKKRINLTVPDAIYERLQAYKEVNGITNDASACLQLITRQLKAQEETELMFKVVRETPVEKLIELSNIGLADIKEALAKQPFPPAE